jgi:2-oxoisovalerate dehydrogenase E1 component alpha subunit
MKKDSPTYRLRKYLENLNLWDEEKEKALRAQNRKDIMESFQKAEKRPKPEVNDLFTDVFDKLTPLLEEQRKEMYEHIAKYPSEYPTELHAQKNAPNPHNQPKKYL